MKEFEKEIVKEYSSPRFQEWKKFLKANEQAIFYDYYFLGFSIVKITQIENYSERQVKRLLNSARRKVFKHIP